MTDSSALSPIPEGEVLAGKYVVERVLGVGGMGIVVAARHQFLDQRVALKFLRDNVPLSTEVTERFIREARAAVKLESQFVARVIDVGVLETGSPFMVMELLEGIDLSQRIEAYAREGPLPIPEAIDRVLEALDALAEAHSKGIVHRDIKPANLFLASRADGSVATKMLDFGISKIMGPDESRNLTRTSSTLGTPVYMAPEQVRSSKSVDMRTDVWAMGVVLYEVLTGRLPFEGDSMGAVFAAILESAPAPLAGLRQGVDPRLDSIVQRCLEKDPARRFADVAQLASALAPFGSGNASASVARAAAVLSRQGQRTEPVTSGALAPSSPSSPVAAVSQPHNTHLSFSQADGVPRSGGLGRVIGAIAAASALAALGFYAVHARSHATVVPASLGEPVGLAPSSAPALSAPPPADEPGTPTPPPTGAVLAPAPSASARAPASSPAKAHAPRPAGAHSAAPSASSSAPPPVALPNDRL